MKTRSTYQVGKEELNFQFTLQEKETTDILYTQLLAEEPGFSILSSGKKEMLSSWHVK